MKGGAKPATGATEHVDRYEVLLAKYDWHSARPPANYQYGVGRGAKAFVTNAELTGGPTPLTSLGPQENDFFAALDRVEARRPALKSRRRKHQQGGDEEGGGGGEGEGDSGHSPGPVVRLSMEDLASIAGGTKTAITPAASSSSGDAATTPTTAETAAAGISGLTTRSARDEAGESAEEYYFASERGVTMHDLLRGKNTAHQANLETLLEMGSPDDQGTWVTHARAWRETGKAKRALRTLEEGCARTGRKGAMIWEERLTYIPRDDTAARRSVLEDATAACPSEETLWLQLIALQPPHERLGCLQRAVMACPASERLWLRVVAAAPDPRDQRRIVKMALQRTQELPLLWAKLARLEPSFATGRRIFADVASRFPSLSLVVEAAKFAEWSAHRELATVPPPPPAATAAADRQQRQATAAVMHSAVCATVKAAAGQYLTPGEPASSRRWMAAAREVCAGDGTGGRYVWTAAYMFLCYVLPRDALAALDGNGHVKSNTGGGGVMDAVQPTWLEDLLAAMDSGMDTTAAAANSNGTSGCGGSWIPPHCPHGVLCALWAAWLLLARSNLLPTSSANGTAGSGGGGTEDGVPWGIVELLKRAVVTAGEDALSSAIAVALERHDDDSLSSGGVVVKEEDREEAVASGSEGILQVKREAPSEEEEVEELAGLQTRSRRGGAVKAEPPADGDGGAAGVNNGAVDSKKPAILVTDEECLPFPFSVVLSHTISGDTDSRSDGGNSCSSRGGFGSEPSLALALAKAFYGRGQYRAALLILRLTTSVEVVVPSLVAATAKCYAALGINDAADACLAAAIAKTLTTSATTASALSVLGGVVGPVATVRVGSGGGGGGIELLWVKIAVHRRSGLGAVCDLEALLTEATAQCPRSERLWLMRLEAARGRVASARTSTSVIHVIGDTDESSTPAAAGAAAPATTGGVAVAIPQAEMRALRTLYTLALTPAHCRACPAVWAYAAVRIEGELFNAAAAARALLLDATVACGGGGGGGGGSSFHHHINSTTATDGEVRQQQQRYAVTLATARARVELMHAGPSQALEVVQEALQRLPKTRDGAFTAATIPFVGELLQLFIDLSVPAARGRAAAQVMRSWRCSREPLALLAVAKVYHSARQYPKALDQAIKAATEGGSGVSGGGDVSAASATDVSADAAAATGGGSNGCGDCAALLWQLAHLPEYRAALGPRIGGPSSQQQQQQLTAEAELDAAAVADPSSLPPLPEADIRRWLFKVLSGRSGSSDSGASATTFEGLRFNRGPLWVEVAKAREPANVTLLGYRDSVESMLARTADLIHL